MGKLETAEKLWQAYCRKTGLTRMGKFSDIAEDTQKAWLHVAEIAIANVCKPDVCEHVGRAIGIADSDRKAAFESLQAEHAKALEEAVKKAIADAVPVKHPDEPPEITGRLCFVDNKLGDDIRVACQMAMDHRSLEALVQLLQLRASLLPGRIADK